MINQLQTQTDHCSYNISINSPRLVLTSASCVHLHAYVDILRFCTIDYICMFQKKRRAVGVRSKYAKIPIKTKLAFLRKVVKEGFSIRDSSTLFAINYSTAKTLMRQFKAHPSPFDLDNLTDLPSPDHSDLKRCSYRQLPSQCQQKMQVSSSGTSAFYLQQASSIRRVQIVSSINC